MSKTEPNEQSIELMASAACEVEQLVAYSQKSTGQWMSLATALREGRYFDAQILLDEIQSLNGVAQGAGMIANAKLQQIQNVDPELVKASRNYRIERKYTAMVKACTTADQVRELLHEHGNMCNESGCPAEALLRSRLVELEPESVH